MAVWTCRRAIVLGALCGSAAWAQPQPLTESREVVLGVVDRRVGWNGHDSGDFLYEAETGWVIESHAIELSGWARYGADITEKTAAGTLQFSDQLINEFIEETSRYSMERGKSERYKEEIESLRKYFLETKTRVAYSHSRLKLHWSVRGSGKFYDQGRGMIKLNLRLKLLSAQPPDPKFLERLKERIDKDLPLI